MFVPVNKRVVIKREHLSRRDIQGSRHLSVHRVNVHMDEEIRSRSFEL